MMLRRLVVVLGIVSALAIVAASAWDIWRARVDTLARAEERLADLALVLAEQTARAIGEVESILLAVGEDFSRRATGPLADDRAFHEQLRAHALAPQIASLVVHDAGGRPVASSRDFPAAEGAAADQEYLRIHREGVVKGAHITASFVSQATGVPTVAMSSGVRNAAGDLTGVVMAELSPAYFTDVYRGLSLGPGGGVRLFHRDGTMIAGDPVSSGAGAGLASTPDQRAIAPGTAVVARVEDPSAGALSSIALRALSGHPLILAVRSTNVHALSAWRREAWTTGTLGAIAAAVVLALTLAIERRLAADARASAALREREARWRLALEGAEHGVFDWNLRTGTLYRSPRYLALLGYAADEVDAQGPAYDQLLHPDDRERIRAVWDGCAAGRISQFAEHAKLLHKDGSVVEVLLSGMVVEREQDGKPARLIGTVTDVSRLKAAEGHAREAEARLTAIVQSAMDAIITVDAGQRVVLFNTAAERMFGIDAREAIGAPLERFIPERFRAAHHEHIERFGHTGETSRRMGTQQALWAVRADGTEFRIEASISHAAVSGQQLFTVILRDITDRIAAEARVREGEERLHAIVQSAMDAIITVDAGQRIVLFNGSAERMFGVAAWRAVGAPLASFIPERFRAAHHDHVARFGRTGETARRMGPQQALRALRADGTEFPIEASIAHATIGGEQLFSVIIRDITARLAADAEIERSHAQLRELGAVMHEVREAEQTRIARELHDELGQALTALKMDVELLESLTPPERPDLLERTGAMRDLLDATVQTTRRISADLRPLVLDDLGLAAAAEWLVDQLRQRARIDCDLVIDSSLADLPEPYASAIFRVMQESLTNVAKHARASCVEMRLAREGEAAVLTVRDDGIGMGQTDQTKPRSFGLRGIRERILVLGGEVRILSQPGGGTIVVVRVPLGDASGREAA